jgi:hypothetical protein
MASTILSDNGVSSGSAGIKTTADGTGVLALQTTTAGGAATTAVTIDTSQNVGIGTTSPTLYSGYTTLQVNNTSTSKGLVAIGPTATGGLFYSDGGQTSITSLGATPVTLGTNNTERMRILTTGNILSLSGGSTTATGTGITFPAAQSASSDVNTLDDYEEGTWTPNLTFGGGSIGITYANRAGWYTKIGNMVSVQYLIFLSSKGSSTGSAVVDSLPFVPVNDSLKRTGAYQYVDRMTPNQVLSITGISQFAFYTISSGPANTVGGLSQTDFASNTYISGSFSYFI